MSIVVEGLWHEYQRGGPEAIVALRDVSLEIADGSVAAIVGVTGSGKSTLVQHFNGLLRPTKGHVWVDGVAIGTARGAELRRLRQRVGMLFQFPEAQLFAETVYDDVAFGLRQLGFDVAAVEARVRAGLRAVALDDGEDMLRRSPFALSGGQRRRVALAGALALRPRVLVLDEPSAGLDAEARDELYAHLLEVRRRDGMTIVIVSHDMAEVAALADVLFVLAGGQLRLSGPPDEVFQRAGEIDQAGLLPPPLAQVVQMAHARGLALEPLRMTPEGVARALAETRSAPRPLSPGGSPHAE
jgi:energy-coupling factor transport system ATP-binding protein